MKDKLRELWADRLFLLLAGLWLAVLSYPYFSQELSDNIRQIQTYNLDTTLMMTRVEEAMAARWFYFRLVDYGHFYFNLSIAAAWLYSLVLPLSERALLGILRLFSILGGLFCIAITYLFAKRYLGRGWAVFCGVVLAFSPWFVEFTDEVKPDTWQIFFLMLSLYWLARAFENTALSGDRHLRWPLAADFNFVLAASAAAGAAFGTKYQGILLIPFLLIAACLVPSRQVGVRFFRTSLRLFAVLAVPLGLGLAVLAHEFYPGRVMLFLQSEGDSAPTSFALFWAIQGSRVGSYLMALVCFAAAGAFVAGFNFLSWRRPLSKGLILVSTGLSFVAAFALSSPWLLYQLQFLPSLYHRSVLQNGSEHYGLHWLDMLFGVNGNPEFFVVHAVCLAAVAGALILVASLARRRIPLSYFPFLTVLGFAAIFLGFLITKMNFVTSLYLLPAVPLVILLAAFALKELGLALAQWITPRQARLAAAALAALIAADQVAVGGHQLLQYPQLVTSMSAGNRALGDWLTRCVPAGTKIVTAAYSYIPPRFPNMVANLGADYDYFLQNDPDLVTINLNDVKDVARQAQISAAAAQTSSGRYYRVLQHSAQWRPGPIFAPYQIYVKTSAKGIRPDCR